MPRGHPDCWDGSGYPHVPGDDDEPDVWEKETSKPQKIDPDTRADFHGDDDSDIWEREGTRNSMSDTGPHRQTHH